MIAWQVGRPNSTAALIAAEYRPTPSVVLLPRWRRSQAKPFGRLIEAEEHLRAVIRPALFGGERVEALGRGEAGEIDASRRSALPRYGQILEQVLHHEARRDVAGEGPWGKIREAPAARRTPGNHLLHERGIEATRLRMGERLAPGHHPDRHRDLIGELAPLPRPGGPEVRDRLSQEAKERLHSGECLAIASGHDH